jgi:hypothetical protein
LVVACVYVAVVLARAGWDPMVLVRVGTRFDPGIAGGSMGYDGQFAYQIALSPTNSVSKLDVPAYRLQRILYPLLARALALGVPAAVPWALIVINLVALAAGTVVSESLLVGFGQSRWWSVVYGLNVGMLMAVRLDLNEPLAFAFIQTGVLSWYRGRRMLGAASFAAAALAKEVTLVLILGYLAVGVFKEGWRKGVLWASMALGPFLVWQGVLVLWLGRAGVGPGGAMATWFEFLPFHGWWGVALYDLDSFVTLSLIVVPMVVVPALLGLSVAARALHQYGLQATSVALLLQSAAYLFLPMSSLTDPLGSSRFSIGLICGLLGVGGQARMRRVLAYTQLWMMTLVFAAGDSFLPSG